MRSIPLVQRKHSEGPEKGSEKFHDQDLLLQIVRWVDPRSGVNFDEMSKRIALIDKIKASRDTLDLEDADWTFLCQRVTGFSAQIVDEDLYALCRTVIDAPQLKAKPATSE